MDSTRTLARRAALFYWLQCLPCPFAYFYVPDRLLVPGDLLGTVDHVRVSEGLLRAAVVAELFSATMTIFALVAYDRLFRRTDEKMSMTMAAMMLASVPISFVNSIFNIAPLVLTKSPALASQLGPGAIAALVTLFLRLHNYGLVVNQFFWALWLFPLGILIMRSQFIPRWLGYPLFAAGTGYVASSLGTLLLPPELRWMTGWTLALGAGEFPALFYMLIWGARSTSATASPGADAFAVGAAGGSA